MPFHRIQCATAWLALALIGSVGVIGTGLHDVFDCCHPGCGAYASEGSAGPIGDHHPACGCCHASHSEHRATRSDAAERPAPRPKTGFLKKPDEDCAICRVLSHFHSTAAIAPPQRVAWACHETVVLAVSSRIAWLARGLEPSRGPPAVIPLRDVASARV